MDKSDVGTQTNCPPMAVFWDLENIQIPKHKSVADILRKIRNTFLTNYVEEDFFVVCDVSKEKKSIIDTLVLCNCTVIHVTSLAKNAADYKLQSLINKFSCRNIGGSVLIISSDVNFLWVLTEARYKYKNNIIIMHKKSVNDTFLKVANESVDFDEFVCDLSNTVQGTIPQNLSFEIEVKNLPNKKTSILKKDLQRLAENSGGKIKEITGSEAIIKYTTPESAERGAKRLHDQKMHGKKIVAALKNNESEPSTSTAAPVRNESLGNKGEAEKLMVDQVKELFKDLKKIELNSLQRFYALKFGHNINVRQIGYTHVIELLRAHPHIFKISGMKYDKKVSLRDNFYTHSDESDDDHSSPVKKRMHI